MKNLIVVSLFLIFNIVSVKAQSKTGKDEMPEMKEYFFVMLTKGSVRNQDSAQLVTIQQGHLENISRLSKEGKCIVAGPFGDDTDWRGILILDVASKEEAEKEILKDPAVKTGRLDYKIHPWWTAKGSVVFK